MDANDYNQDYQGFGGFVDQMKDFLKQKDSVCVCRIIQTV